jgi:hypothetical protein
MATYTITTTSTLYTTYEIEADTLEQAIHEAETADGLSELTSWTEDTEVYSVEEETEEEEN